MLPEELAEARRAAGVHVPAPLEVNALIDTGAASCAAVQEVIDALGIEPTGYACVDTPFVCRADTLQYNVRVGFPGGLYLETDQLVEITLPIQDVQFLVGRDVLSRCLLVYNGQLGSFTFCW